MSYYDQGRSVPARGVRADVLGSAQEAARRHHRPMRRSAGEQRPARVPHMHDDEFTKQYIETALWSSSDDRGDSLTRYDLAPQTYDFLKRDAAAFKQQNAVLLDRAYMDTGYHYTPGNAGHDFWLTRNHHGAGFWDRDLGEVGNMLTRVAHQWPEVDLYVGDDDLVYAGGHESWANERRPARVDRFARRGEFWHGTGASESPVTKRGQHGTLYLYKIEYKGKDDPASPVFDMRIWAYNLEHAEDKFYGGADSEGWTIISLTRVDDAKPEHRRVKHRPSGAGECAREDCIGIHTHHDMGPEAMRALNASERPSRPGFYAVYPNGRIASGPYTERGQADDEAKKIGGFVQFEAGEARESYGHRFEEASPGLQAAIQLAEEEYGYDRRGLRWYWGWSPDTDVDFVKMKFFNGEAFAGRMGHDSWIVEQTLQRVIEKVKSYRGGQIPSAGEAGQPVDFHDIRMGDRVTISSRFGQNRTGRAVMRGPAGWVLNMGGPHGTPDIATPENFVSASRRGGGAGEASEGRQWQLLINYNAKRDPSIEKEIKKRFGITPMEVDFNEQAGVSFLYYNMPNDETAYRYGREIVRNLRTTPPVRVLYGTKGHQFRFIREPSAGEVEVDEKVSHADREKLPPSAFALKKRRALLLTDKDGKLDIGHVKAAAGRLSMMKHLGHLKPGEWKEGHARIMAAGKKVGLKVKEVREAFNAKHEAKEGFAVATRSSEEVEQADAVRSIILKSPQDIYTFAAPSVRAMTQETFIVIPMDLHGSPLSPKPYMVAMGQRDRVQVDPGDVLRPVIESNAAAFVVCHQHPSGRPHPSDADAELTETIREAARVACPSVAFLDHCILGANEIYSFRDKKVHKIR